MSNQNQPNNPADAPLFYDLDGLYLLDTRHMGHIGTIASYLVPYANDADRFMLIECGPGSTLETLEQAISQAGFNMNGLADILVTHIHLDHAGAAGTLAQKYGAQVYVHEGGAPHLADPSRLWTSASRIYGELMQTLWGEMQPVPAQQIITIQDNDVLELGNHNIKVMHSPGHAGSHVVFQIDGDVFTGDAAAIAMGDAGDACTLVRPAVPPPEINLELWHNTFETLRKCGANRLLLTHFGAINDPRAHLDAAEAETHQWAELILEGLHAGEDDDALAARLRNRTQEAYEAADVPANVMARYNVTSNDGMSVAGLKRYWKKHHPEELER